MSPQLHLTICSTILPIPCIPTVYELGYHAVPPPCPPPGGAKAPPPLSIPPRFPQKSLMFFCEVGTKFRVIQSRGMRWAGHVARMGEKRGVYKGFVGKPEGRRPLGRPRRRWEDKIKLLAPELFFFNFSTPCI